MRYMETVIERLEKVERQNRALRRVGGIALVLFAAILMMGQTPSRPHTIEAGQFIVRDDAGKIRAALYSKGERVVLALQDQNEKPRAVLDLGKDGAPSLRLFDEDGKARAGLSHRATGGSLLTLRDSNGKSRAMFITRPDGSPGLSLMDANSKERVLLTTKKGGEPILSMMDSSAHERMTLDLDDEGYATLALLDKTRARAMLGRTAIHVMRKRRVTALADSALIFFDAEGNVIFSKP